MAPPLALGEVPEEVRKIATPHCNLTHCQQVEVLKECFASRLGNSTDS